MDSKEFASDFLSAFNAHIISFNVDVTNTGQDLHALGHHQAISYISHATYSIKIACYVPFIPINKSLMDHFSVNEDGTHLYEVKTSSYCDPSTGLTSHRIELMYRCMDYDKFILAVKNVAYDRYSKEFHEQLEDKLDKV